MKFKLVMTITREYEVTKEDLRNMYGGLTNFEEALELDIENTKDDPSLFMESDDSKITVDGVLVP